MGAHTCSLSTEKSEARRSRLGPPWATEQNPVSRDKPINKPEKSLNCRPVSAHPNKILLRLEEELSVTLKNRSKPYR